MGDTSNRPPWALERGKMTIVEWLAAHQLELQDFEPWKVSYDNLLKRIVVPVFTTGGKYSMDIIRNLETEPRYDLKPQGCRPSCLLYGLQQAKGAIEYHGFAVVVEGFSDCLALVKHGAEMTVSSITSNISLVQYALLSRLTDQIVVWADGDKAGYEFAQKVGHLPGSVIGITVRDKDPAQYIAEGGNPENVIGVAMLNLNRLSYIELDAAGQIAKAIECDYNKV